MQADLPQRTSLWFSTVGTRVGRTARGLVTALWELAGSRQVFNAIAGLALVVLVYAAQQCFLAQRSLATIAEAQQVGGYATMRQLRALGWAPPSPEQAATIDPAKLDQRSSPDAAKPTSTASAPAAASPAPAAAR